MTLENPLALALNSNFKIVNINQVHLYSYSFHALRGNELEHLYEYVQVIKGKANLCFIIGV